MVNLTHDIYPVLTAHASDLDAGEWLLYYFDGQLYLKVGSASPVQVISNALAETEQATIETPASGESDKYVSVRRFWQGITKFLSLANTWAALQTFANIVVKQIYTTSQSFTLTGANPSQAINLDLGSLITIDLTGASDTATLTFSNAKEGASYWIKIIQATTAVNISIANSGRFDGETGAIITGTNSTNLAIFLLYDGSGYFFNKSEVS